MYKAEFVPVTFYSDAVWMIEQAEDIRKERGYVRSVEECRLCRSALLLLAFAFEAFVNDQITGLSLVKGDSFKKDKSDLNQRVKERVKELKSSKARPPLKLDNFSRILTQFTLLSESKCGICPNFCVSPFYSLVQIFRHRHENVHGMTEFLSQELTPTGSQASGWEICQYLEPVRCFARDWYLAVSEYFSWLNEHPSPDGAYSGEISSYQHVYFRLIGKIAQSPMREKALIKRLIVNREEEVAEVGSYGSKIAYRYWNKSLCFSVRITALPTIESTCKQRGSSVELEVHPETAVHPVGGRFERPEKVRGANLQEAFQDLLPLIRKAYSPPDSSWIDSEITDFIALR